MTNKFTNQRYMNMYNERFSENKSINGHIKNTTGIFKLITSQEICSKRNLHHQHDIQAHQIQQYKRNNILKNFKLSSQTTIKVNLVNLYSIYITRKLP